MRNKRWPYIVISIIIAIAFWAFVRSIEDPTATKTLYNVDVTVVGEDVLQSSGLMITQEPELTVDLTVQGSATDIAKVTRRNITVTVNVSHITSAGDYSIAYEITLPSSVSSTTVSATAVSPETFDITVGSVYSKTVPVEVNFTGSIANGYTAGDLTISPEQITVMGEESLVDTIDHALVTIQGANLTETVNQDFSYTLIDTEGQEVDLSSVICSTDTVFVNMPVLMEKTVKLDVTLIDGGGATADDATYSISPETITISGTEEALDTLNTISLGEIDLSEVITTETFEFPINLDPSLNNLSGESSATVEISIEGLTTKTFSTNNISTINTPTGAQVSLVTTSLDVQIRGEESAVSSISASQVRAVADLSSLSSASGMFTVPVTVYIDGSSDVGTVGSYSVTVQIQ